MDNLDYIETYFSTRPDPATTAAFEARLLSDPAFAEEVAFYLSAHEAAREENELERKDRFRKIYQENQAAGSSPDMKAAGPSPFAKTSRPAPVRKLVTYMAAAAAVAAIIVSVYLFGGHDSPRELALRYEKEQLQTLGVTMSARTDSIQNGLRLYNEGKSGDALLYFENIVRSDTSNFTAKQYAGLSALKLKEYDKALAWFNQLESYQELYANPALFYQAITLMERNQSGDPAKAKQLLQKIVDKDLEGKEIAQEWLRKWQFFYNN